MPGFIILRIISNGVFGKSFDGAGASHFVPSVLQQDHPPYREGHDEIGFAVGGVEAEGRDGVLLAGLEIAEFFVFGILAVTDPAAQIAAPAEGEDVVGMGPEDLLVGVQGIILLKRGMVISNNKSKRVICTINGVNRDGVGPEGQ
jgi:hypothetical protein